MVTPIALPGRYHEVIVFQFTVSMVFIVCTTKDFSRLVVVSIFIGSPVAYYFMYRWLQRFAYRVNISIWMFLFAGFSAMAVAVITVSFRSIKAALANPVKSLKME